MDNEKIEILNNLNSRYEMFTEQLRLVEQQISELSLFSEELDIINQNKNSDILAPIGKSVYAPVRVNTEKKMLVEVGAGYLINKDIKETKEVIMEQKQRLESFKIQISSEIENLTKELQSLIAQ
jgi:prefoldin alpha subunit